MKRWLLALLATTTLCGIDKAKADLVWASQTGAFGQSFANPTVLSGPSSTIYNDYDQYNLARGPDYFDIGSVYYNFTLTLTAARSSYSEGNSSYYAVDAIDSYVNTGGSASSHSSEGSSTIVATALPAYSGIAAITAPVGSSGYASQNEGISLLVTAAGNPDNAPTYVVPSPTLDPILTFYDDSGNELAIVEITEGNSVVVSGTITGLSDLNFSVSSPFDYTVQVDVPEPASMAVLGLGAAGAALARRRKRVI